MKQKANQPTVEICWLFCVHLFGWQCSISCGWMLFGWQYSLSCGCLLLIENRPSGSWWSLYVFHYWAGIAQWLECRTCDWKVEGLNPCRSSRRIFFSMVNFLCWLLFRFLFRPRATTVACKRSRHSARSAGGGLQLNTYVALHEVTWCMVVWCTQNAPRRQQIHVAPAMPDL